MYLQEYGIPYGAESAIDADPLVKNRMAQEKAKSGNLFFKELRLRLDALGPDYRYPYFFVEAATRGYYFDTTCYVGTNCLGMGADINTWSANRYIDLFQTETWGATDIPAEMQKQIGLLAANMPNTYISAGMIISTGGIVLSPPTSFQPVLNNIVPAYGASFEHIYAYESIGYTQPGTGKTYATILNEYSVKVPRMFNPIGNSAVSDTTPPTVAITCPLDSTPPAVYNVNSINLVGTASDAGSGVKTVQYRVNSGAWTDAVGTTSWNIKGTTPLLTAGLNTIEVRAIDNAGKITLPAQYAKVTVKHDPSAAGAVAPSVPHRIYSNILDYTEPWSEQLRIAKNIHADAIDVSDRQIELNGYTNANFQEATSQGIQVIMHLHPTAINDPLQFFDFGIQSVADARFALVEDMINKYPSVSGVHFEEYHQVNYQGYSIAERQKHLTDFLRRTRTLTNSKGMSLSFNTYSVTISYVRDVEGIDFATLESEHLVDFVVVQTSSTQPLSTTDTVISNYKTVLPTIVVIPAAYGYDGGGGGTLARPACVANKWAVRECYSQNFLPYIDHFKNSYVWVCQIPWGRSYTDFIPMQDGYTIPGLIMPTAPDPATVGIAPGSIDQFGQAEWYPLRYNGMYSMEYIVNQMLLPGGAPPSSSGTASTLCAIPSAPAPATCTDTFQNGDEAGKDCGGSCPNPCPPPECHTGCPGGCADIGQPDPDTSCPGRVCVSNIGQRCSGTGDKCLIETCQADGSCGNPIPITYLGSDTCTTFSCDPNTGGKRFTYNNGIACDGKNLCLEDGSGKCDNGICRGAPKNCADTNACTYDSCDPDTGQCSNPEVCGGLVPCGRLVDNPATTDINEQAPCGVCSLFYMIKSLINYAAKLSFALAVFALVISGLLYSTSAGDSRRIDLAKNTAYYAVVGLLIIFLAWIVIAAILQAMGSASMAAWNQVNCAL